jgi:hypothetical protein
MPIVLPQVETKADVLKDFGHPRGTLAIVAVFGLLFAIAWFVMYVFVFLERGAPHS